MDLYYQWLKSQVEFLDFPETYDRLFAALNEKIFTYKHPMDKNRALEALELRNEYRKETSRRGPSPDAFPPTVLELLVSIAKRMNYICASFDEDRTKELFWRLLANLDLSRMSDPYYERLGGDGRVDIILNTFLERTYAANGRGGLFPMAKPRQNQREVELWYQMNQYLSDPYGEDLKSY